MNRSYLVIAFLIIICIGLAVAVTLTKNQIIPDKFSLFKKTTPDIHEVGSTFVVYLDNPNIGQIAVQVRLPEKARYDSGAPIIVHVPTFFTQDSGDFPIMTELTDRGFIEISLVYPGKETTFNVQSDGENDYGGQWSKEALRDAILFAGGKKSNSDGLPLHRIIALRPLYKNLGIYAFSHPGIIATAVLAEYGDELGVDYFVGRENPTEPMISAVELGHFQDNKPIHNQAYDFQTDYSLEGIDLNYDSVRWSKELDIPYFDLNKNGEVDIPGDYVLGSQIPKMFGYKMYSFEMLQALLDNGSLTENDWPLDLVEAEMAEELWYERNALTYYPKLRIKDLDLKVMLVFAERDHVQPALDKPHVHQAYNGFNNAGLWIRLNPDQSYVSALDQELGSIYEEHNANSEPEDWSDAYTWGHPDKFGASKLVPLAAIMEMADRIEAEEWGVDLDREIVIR